MKNINYGVIIEKRDTDFNREIGTTGISYEIVNPSGNWEDSLPSDERQNQPRETNRCVSFSALNSIETQFNYLIKQEKIPIETLRYLTAEGYLVNGKLECSDRFTAKMSGTTAYGNSLQKVWDSIRKDGLLPEKDYPPINVPIQNDIANDIPQNLKDKAKKFLQFFTIQYEFIGTSIQAIETALRQAPVQIASPVCNWNDYIVYPCGDKVARHATLIYDVDNVIRDFDSYEPFRKQLALNFYISQALKGVLRPTEPSKPQHTFVRDIVFGEKSNEVYQLQRCLKYLGYMTLNATGYYGEITRKAVLQLQFDKKLGSPALLKLLNGKRVGINTRKYLNSEFSDIEYTGNWILDIIKNVVGIFGTLLGIDKK